MQTWELQNRWSLKRSLEITMSNRGSQFAQDHTWMAPEYFQHGTLHSLSGQLLSHVHNWKVFPGVQTELPVFQFVLLLGIPWKILYFLSLHPVAPDSLIIIYHILWYVNLPCIGDLRTSHSTPGAASSVLSGEEGSPLHLLSEVCQVSPGCH